MGKKFKSNKRFLLFLKIQDIKGNSFVKDKFCWDEICL